MSSSAKICSKGPARGWRSNAATVSSNEPKEVASSPLRSTRAAEMNSGTKKMTFTHRVAP